MRKFEKEDGLQINEKAGESTLRKVFGDPICDELLLVHRSQVQLREIADRFCHDPDRGYQVTKTKRSDIYRKYRRYIPLVLVFLLFGVLARQLYLRSFLRGGQA